MKHYRQLSLKERYQIDALHEMGLNQSAIAKRLNRSRSTIFREMKRNTLASQAYRGGMAQNACNARRKQAHKAKFNNQGIINWIRRMLRQQWSPEQIVGVLGQSDPSRAVSHEWIYRYVRKDRANGGRLYTHLRQSHKGLRKRYGSRTVQSTIPNRVDIQYRPDCVTQRARLGDWEGDTIIGADLKSVLVTLVERKSGLLRCTKLKSRHSRAIAQTIVRLLRPFKNHVHTITFDNGTEFGRHQHISQSLNADIYFAKPYCSWQRGSNENTNGLLRQYFPKKTNFNDISEKTLHRAVGKINHRPGKRHGYKSPVEVFYQLKNQDSICCSY